MKRLQQIAETTLTLCSSETGLISHYDLTVHPIHFNGSLIPMTEIQS